MGTEMTWYQKEFTKPTEELEKGKEAKRKKNC